MITNFNLSNLKKSLLKDFRILDKRSHEEYSDKFRLIFLSLQEVPKYWEECVTELIRQLYLIKNMENLTKESKPYLSGEYNDFFTSSMTDNLTEEEAVAYSESYLKELERQSALRFTAKKNREEGREEGIEIGEAKGKEEERRKSIRLMLSFGISAQKIAENYEMPLEEVLRLAESE